MGNKTSLGTVYSASPTSPATYDIAGFDALIDWVEVGEITNVGDIGATFQDVTHIPLKTGITEHNKGAIDYGELNMTAADDPTDAGQDLVESGTDGATLNTTYSHKIELSDGTILYSIGKFFANPISIGDANAMVNRNINVKLSGKVLRKKPA